MKRSSFRKTSMTWGIDVDTAAGGVEPRLHPCVAGFKTLANRASRGNISWNFLEP